MKNFFYYGITVIIWGTTWLGIKFQLGIVDPMVSVCYRFLLAALILNVYCLLARLNMSFTLKEHVLMGLQGFFLFAINYWLFYVAEVYIVSGLAAVIFSTIVFMNIINGAVFLKSPIELRMIIGALLGLVGIGLVFWPEISNFQLTKTSVLGLSLGMAATFFASLGNIISAYNQKRSLPVIQTNAYGMAYGSLIMLVTALVTKREFGFYVSPAYIGSLIYLAVFGSIIAFGCYLTLVGRIGAGRAAYASLLFPLVALGISTFFEGYQWTAFAITGITSIMAGNLLILKRGPFRFENR
ncbi:MAG: DMT family transporter [Desulfobacterales bacterium]